MSHKTSCNNLLHLQTLCLKTSTIFFLIKCSFLQRINRGAAGLLGAETIISSKNSDFQKQKCTFKVNYCCTIQSGSGHLSRSLSFHCFPKARMCFQDKMYRTQRQYKMKVDTSQLLYRSKSAFPKRITKYKNKLQNESGHPQGIYCCQHCCCWRIFAIVWNCGGQWKAMQQLSDERLLQMRSFFLQTNALDPKDKYNWCFRLDRQKKALQRLLDERHLQMKSVFLPRKIDEIDMTVHYWCCFSFNHLVHVPWYFK